MMQIEKIVPFWVGDFYRFRVELMDEDGTYKVEVGADAVYNYPLMSQCIFGKTARLYWHDEIDELVRKDHEDMVSPTFVWRAFIESKLTKPESSH